MPAYCYGTASGPTFFAKEDHNSVPIDGPTIVPNYISNDIFGHSKTLALTKISKVV